ncbi:hypothetical protein [Rarobacter incanus]|uniref:Uncharacterized protein n=1 Tax=Rarobacter incanus TaxID=153494 RepID=A0A542SRS2_9MICO|nr:hypothetical protein [Rarobacter incanus]TQK77311.1 hypothetical protein FB389_2035 [Rarobacter incanus]
MRTTPRSAPKIVVAIFTALAASLGVLGAAAPANAASATTVTGTVTSNGTATPASEVEVRLYAGYDDEPYDWE